MAKINQTQITKDIFALAEKRFGFVPNLIKALNKHPLVMKLYTDGVFLFEDNGLLTPKEQQVVYLAISAENKCYYCTAAHGFVAQKVAGLEAAEVESILNGKLSSNARYNALITSARLTLEKRGWLTTDDLKKLEDLGVGKEQIMEIIGLIALKTITNYVNHIEETPIDSAFNTDNQVEVA